MSSLCHLEMPARGYHRHTKEEDELCFSTRYNRALARIRVLEEASKRWRKWEADIGLGIRVNTRGACLPASGLMLWNGDGFALVWFDGCDQPVVWPCNDLEVV